jgi:hypothetical protein
MLFKSFFKKELSKMSPDGAKISEMTGAKTFGDATKMILGKTPVGGTIAKSVPMAVDVSADGMRKKSKALKGTTVSYSGIKTSSQGLLTGVKTEKKTLLGG